MAGPVIYLAMPGTARSALEFYAKVFDGSAEVHTFAEFGRTDGPATAVAHGELTGSVRLFMCDAGVDEPLSVLEHTKLALLGTAPSQTLHRWFDRLSQTGQVVDPLAPKPWGATDGEVIDQHSLRWLIGYEADT